MIDNQNIDGVLRRLQLQPKLLLDGFLQAWTAAWGVILNDGVCNGLRCRISPDRLQSILRLRQLNVVPSGQSSFVYDGAF